MTPSKKKKGKQRHPPPRYRKQEKAEASRVKADAGQGPASPAAPVAAPPARREPARPRKGRVVSLDPLAPIIVRSGRPMNAHADADPAQFPPPSTIAGCLRTAWARATGRPFGAELAQLAVGGPLLIRDDAEVLVPKPADALYFGGSAAKGESPRCVRARPGRSAAAAALICPRDCCPCSWLIKRSTSPAMVQRGGRGTISWPSATARTCPSIASGGTAGRPPRAIDAHTCPSIHPPEPRRPVRCTRPRDWTWTRPPAAFRTRTDGRTAAAGPYDADSPSGGLRLLVRCAEALAPALVYLGGKRRLAALEPEPDPRWPAPPDGWLERLCHAGGLCLTLLTPGAFSAGYRPGWLDDALTGSPPGAPGLELRLRAAAVERWQPHSGWDLALSQPRPARKLVPAGATYWFEVLGDCEKDAAAAIWLASVSDEQQDRRDGFGLALPCPWAPGDDTGAG